MRARVSWLERIRDALADDRFVLHAQPIRNLHTGEIGHHELLLRMLGDDGELIRPGAFLPLAERFGLTPEIDRWVTDARHRAAGRRSRRRSARSRSTFPGRR